MNEDNGYLKDKDGHTGHTGDNHSPEVEARRTQDLFTRLSDRADELIAERKAVIEAPLRLLLEQCEAALLSIASMSHAFRSTLPHELNEKQALRALSLIEAWKAEDADNQKAGSRGGI